MMNYKIAIFSNSTKILEQELDVGTYILGRSQTADIRLDIPEVSRKHLEIIVDENGIILTNLSSHGSFWNKKVIQPGFCLQPDMEIALGKNTFLKNISEIGDSDETNIASAIPAVMQFLKATKNFSFGVRVTDEKAKKSFIPGTPTLSLITAATNQVWIIHQGLIQKATFMPLTFPAIWQARQGL